MMQLTSGTHDIEKVGLLSSPFEPANSRGFRIICTNTVIAGRSDRQPEPHVQF